MTLIILHTSCKATLLFGKTPYIDIPDVLIERNNTFKEKLNVMELTLVYYLLCSFFIYPCINGCF